MEKEAKRPADLIEVVVNGVAREMRAGSSLSDLVGELGLEPSRVAVELNLTIVSRAVWDSSILKHGDRLEIVHFVGGG